MINIGGNYSNTVSFNYADFIMPVKLQKDNEYLPELKKKFESLTVEINHMDFDEGSNSRLLNFSEDIESSIEMYLKGDLIEALKIVENLLLIIKDERNVVTDIRNSFAFPGRINPPDEVQLFRARLNDHIEDFEAVDMLHIPFDRRELVSTERFSIPGLPCLYFGDTSYCCWIELGWPADYMFNVSPVVIEDSFQLFNLLVTSYDVYELIGGCDDKHQLELLLKLLMLNIATSFKIRDEDRKFKSEYIFSQMLMLACNHLGLDGIIYYSKRVESEAFAMTTGVDVVLFAKYNGNIISDVCNHIKIGRSFNYSMYKQLMPSLKYREYNMNIDNISAPPNNIGDYRRQFPYNETEFYGFDKYLFANWDRANDNWQIKAEI